MANQVEIIMGTYENYLLGFKVGKDKNGSETLTQSFITKSHMGAVKTLAISGKFVASGGSDGNVIIYNMQTRREIQTLDFHEEQVNSVAFTPKSTHILSGSNDGKMCAVRVGSWQKEATWEKAHAGSPVTEISCHPSGKLALSLGNDLTLRTWNLVKGRVAYTHNLKNPKNQGRTPDCLAWSTDGDYFCLSTARAVEIWSLSTAGLTKEQACESKPTAVCWLSNELLAVGLENGKIMMVPVNGSTTNDVKLIEAHKERVKGIALVNDIIVTASSAGEVILWDFERTDQTWKRICSTKMNVRPICIGLLDLNQFDDDYILKREEEEKVQEVAKTSVNAQIKPANVGSVSVEYEGDDDDLEIIFSSNKIPNKAIPNNQKTNTEPQIKRHSPVKNKKNKQEFVESNNNNDRSKNKKESNLKFLMRQNKLNEEVSGWEESSISIKKRKYKGSQADTQTASNNENITLTSIKSKVKKPLTTEDIEDEQKVIKDDENVVLRMASGENKKSQKLTKKNNAPCNETKSKKRVCPTFGELKDRRRIKLDKKVKKVKLLKSSGIPSM